MAIKDKSSGNKSFNPEKSLHRAGKAKIRSQKWSLEVLGKTYVWSNKMDRVSIIREGLPYESVEVISRRSNLSIKQVLHIMDLPPNDI